MARYLMKPISGLQSCDPLYTGVGVIEKEGGEIPLSELCENELPGIGTWAELIMRRIRMHDNTIAELAVSDHDISVLNFLSLRQGKYRDAKEETLSIYIDHIGRQLRGGTHEA